MAKEITKKNSTGKSTNTRNARDIVRFKIWVTTGHLDRAVDSTTTTTNELIH